jgi:cytochrome c oxidase cbb3-type subunit III
MRISLLVFAVFALSALWCGCADAPGKPLAADTPIVPSEISDFNVLYSENCAGCHGPEGRGGAAISLGDPVYLAIADDTILRRAATNGIPGTSMPAFAQSAGGMLTEKQIDLIVSGIRERWSQPNLLSGANPPPYSTTSPGDSSRGSQVYATFCSSCHGVQGKGGANASSIVDGSVLALLNDQELRTIVIVGRPDLGAPDWRNDVPGTAMSAQDVSDVVAWLASQRSKFPGQPYANPNTLKSPGEVQ